MSDKFGRKLPFIIKVIKISGRFCQVDIDNWVAHTLSSHNHAIWCNVSAIISIMLACQVAWNKIYSQMEGDLMWGIY